MNKEGFKVFDKHWNIELTPKEFPDKYIDLLKSVFDVKEDLIESQIGNLYIYRISK